MTQSNHLASGKSSDLPHCELQFAENRWVVSGGSVTGAYDVVGFLDVNRVGFDVNPE